MRNRRILPRMCAMLGAACILLIAAHPARAQSGLLRACKTGRDVQLAFQGASRLSELLNTLTNASGNPTGQAVQTGTPLYQLIAGDSEVLKDRAVLELLAAAQDGAVEWEAIKDLDLHPALPDLVRFMQDDARFSETVAALRARGDRKPTCGSRMIGAGGGTCGLTLPLEVLAQQVDGAAFVGGPAATDGAVEQEPVRQSLSHGESATGTKMVGGCDRAPLTGPQSCGGFTMPLEDTAKVHEELADAAVDAIKAAGRDADKAAENLNELLQQPRWKKAFEKTCMGRHPIAFKALLYNYLLGYSSLAIAYAANPSEEFPFDYATSTLVLGAMWGEVACRTHYESPGALAAEGERVSFWKEFGQKYWAYTKMVPVEVAGLVFFSAAEDAIRGKDVFSKEYLEKYGREALYIGVWDMAWGNVKAITILNPLYLRVFPGWAGRINQMAEPLFTQGPMRALNYAMIRNSPGVTIDLLLRIATRSVDTWSFLEGKRWFSEWGTTLGEEKLVGGPEPPSVLDEMQADTAPAVQTPHEAPAPEIPPDGKTSGGPPPAAETSGVPPPAEEGPPVQAP